ncbi:serine hydrolase [Phaeovulum sp.]|uniref:D-alanyl-D-alanine carboxypeptidase family protein n=1 Tax=Phaeovulum sp. TaxID=2934796 RepID=UPI0039E5278D
MTTLTRWVRYGLLTLILFIAPILAQAAPYAALVMDARTGEVLYSTNADTRLHPASLTKMMTLYITFEAIERGEISLDTMVTVSKNAASEPPSKLGLRAGQKIAVRYLIRAAAIKSANDAATALGDHIGGDEAHFAARMNRTAKALGMKNTTFKNANGLTREGHRSTARDMTVLGRRLFYDFPQYYNIFSRRTADAGMAKVANTNRRFLSAYEGADGIKTGYTNPAGFNLTASAKRGNKRIIATIFGGTSTAQRNAKMAELLDIGFGRAPGRVKEDKPAAPQYLAEATSEPAQNTAGASGKTIRLVAAPSRSPRPLMRPGAQRPDADAIAFAVAAAVAAQITPVPATAAVIPDTAPIPAALQLASADTPRPLPAPVRPTAIANTALAEIAPDTPDFAQATAPQPETLHLAKVAAAELASANEEDLYAEGDRDDPAFGSQFLQSTTPQPETLALTESVAPRARPETLILASLTPEAPGPREEPEVIARVSSSGGRHWGISLGKYNSQYQAERQLLQTALMESDTLGDALRKVAKRKTGFEANFVGMNRDTADLACRRLHARNADCTVIGP